MNDFKFAFRQLLKNPGFTAVAVLTLALGIGANTAMFSLVNGVLLKPLPYPDSDRLVSLSENQRGVTLVAARAEMKGITERLSQQFELSRGWSVTMLPLQEQLVRGSERPLYVLFGAVGFVLLIACANVANLLLARASGRAREFAIRGALGADRFRIVRQLVLESLTLAGFGAAVGWLLARWGLAAVLKLGAGLPRLENVHLDMQVAGFSILVTVVTGIRSEERRV